MRAYRGVVGPLGDVGYHSPPLGAWRNCEDSARGVLASQETIDCLASCSFQWGPIAICANR